MSQNTPAATIGMVFGVFDGFHQGHQHFLQESAKHCQKLIVVVALPETVRVLKKRTPRFTCEERMERIRAFNPKWEVLPGDAKIGTWSALKKYRPQIVLLGYDQVALEKELQNIGTPFRFIDSHEPHKYKSSLLHKEETSQ